MYEFFVGCVYESNSRVILVPKLPNQNKKEYWRWFQRRVFFCLGWCFFRPFLGAKKSFSFLIFYLCLGSMEVKDIYHQLVLTMFYYYVLAIVIYSYRQFIYSAKLLQGLYVYLKLNQICLSFISKNLQFCRAY